MEEIKEIGSARDTLPLSSEKQSSATSLELEVREFYQLSPEHRVNPEPQVRTQPQSTLLWARRDPEQKIQLSDARTAEPRKLC